MQQAINEPFQERLDQPLVEKIHEPNNHKPPKSDCQDDRIKRNEEFMKIVQQSVKLAAPLSESSNVIDHFSTSVTNLHNDFRSACLDFLFRQGATFRLDHYRKIEELLWKRCYHDLYRFHKRNRHLVKKHDEQLFFMRFYSGLGFYSNLILKLRIICRTDRSIILPEPLNYSLSAVDNFTMFRNRGHNDDVNADVQNCKSKQPREPLVDWAQDAIYRSLVYMGDIARYLSELDANQNHKKLSQYYYINACKYCPENGLPFNQLATLSGDNNYNLDGIANYMRSCLKQKPFDGSYDNIKNLFDLNKNSFTQMFNQDYIKTAAQVLSSKDPSLAAECLIRNVIVSFIKLISDLHFVINQTTMQPATLDNLDIELTLFFEMLREALDIDPIEPILKESDYDKRTIFTPIPYGQVQHIKPRYVDSTIMFEFCSIALMLQTNCFRKASKKSCDIDSKIENQVINYVNTLTLNLLHYSTTKCSKMILCKIQALRLSKTTPVEIELTTCKHYTTILEEIYTQTYLPTIKVFCDWLLAHSNIITKNLQAFRSFSSDLSELVILLSELLKVSTELDRPEVCKADTITNQLITHNHDNTNEEDYELTLEREKIFNHIYDGPEWRQLYPLSCDFPLVGLEAVGSVHKLNINFDFKRELESSESGFIAVQCLEAFNEALTFWFTKGLASSSRIDTP